MSASHPRPRRRSGELRGAAPAALATRAVSRRSLLAGGLGTLTLAGLAGCSAPTDVGPIPDQPVSGGILQYGQDVQPLAGGLDPYQTTAFASQNIYVQIYDTLLSRDDAGELLPALAERWEQPTPDTWLFTLRGNAAFSDGTPVTPADVVFSYRTMKAEGRFQAPYLHALESVEARGDDQVLFTLSRPSRAFIGLVSSDMGGSIVSEAWYSARSPEQRAREAFGSGPFQLTDWQDNIVLKLRRNEHYWDEGRPYLDGVDFRIIPDDQARIAALRQGTVDAIWIGDQQLAEQVAHESFTIAQAAETRSMYCYVNSATGPMAERTFRQAVSAALDRSHLAELASYGYGKPSLVMPIGAPNALRPEADTPFYTRDLELARRLVTESGVADPRITLTYPSDASFARDLPIYEIMQAQLAEAGITLQLRALPWVDVLTRRLQGQYEDLIAVPGVCLPDRLGYFSQILDPNSPATLLSPDAEPIWQMLIDVDAEDDDAERARKHRQLENEMADKALVIIPFAQGQRQEIWGPVWQGYTADPYCYRHNMRYGWKVPS